MRISKYVYAQITHLIAIATICPFIIYAQAFHETSQSSGVNHHYYSPILVGGGVAVFDYNNDGWLDIYLTGGFMPDKLYRNNGDATFTETGVTAGIDQWANSITVGVTTGDINNDGYRDILVTRWEMPVGLVPLTTNILYRNNGNGTFTDITVAAGITGKARGAAATMGDYNLDGWLDIYIVNYVDTQDFIRDSNGSAIGYAYTGFANFLYKNNGNGNFTEVASQLHVGDKGTGLAGAFSDYDNDGDLDIFVVNDYGSWTLPNKLYRNEYPIDSFTDVGNFSNFNSEIYGMGIAIGDYDENGYLDYYVTNIGDNPLHKNNGNGTFQNTASQAGVNNGNIGALLTSGWGSAFFDYDHDTQLDLFVSNGQIPVPAFIANIDNDPNKLFKNNGNGTFTDVSIAEGVSDSTRGRGFAIGDFDNDGDIDMIVVVTVEQNTAQEHTLLFRNDLSNGNNWLKVQLEGTTNNRDGFGSRVEVYAGGRKFIREIDGGSSHASQNTSIAHFGLANYAIADSVSVIWLGGAKQTVKHIRANSFLKIIEGGNTQLLTEFHSAICADDSFYAGGAYQTTQGIYRDTNSVALNIDSIAITHLTVNPIPHTLHYNEICQGDSFLYNGISYYNDTTRQDTSVSSQGCDSIVIFTLHLTPFPVTYANPKICAGDSFFASGNWQAISGTYYDTIPAALCNRITVTNLNVIPPMTPDTVTAYICPGDSIWLDGAFRNLEDYYTDSLTSFFGCDSVVVTWLDILEPQIIEWQYTLCYGDTDYFGSFVLTSKGTYSDTFENFAGCDSIVLVYVQVDTSYAIHRDWNIAEGDSFFAGGIWRKETGVYLDRLLAENGCDSIIYTHLYVDSLNLIFENTADLNLSIYPNPAHKQITVSYSLPVSCGIEIEISSVSGKQLSLFKFLKTTGNHADNINLDNFSPGVYIFSIITPYSAQIKKIIVY